MKIVDSKRIPIESVLDSLKNVRLIGFGRPFVYEKASIDHICVDTNLIFPAQHYVLESNILHILDIYHYVRKNFDLNVFSSYDAWSFKYEGSDEYIPFLPPIIEESTDENGKTVFLINDGMHRVYTSRLIQAYDDYMHVIQISNVPKEYPYYSYPNVNGWDDVKRVAVVPETKKRYRNPANYKDLFRDFNEVHPGVTRKR